ncbi:malate dehydrogenase [Campylobacter sp. RM10532]|uniref:Malate dehydrogenase n=1 Tax=Campylobacter molothri TaxID=1032242 RepID=A0ACC5W1L6_9BACT|nr:malate dehydrogenase [Campylobacter sp. RM10542]MBZ7930460.1 malate dehydrogenase [Campylobacter sp. W0067]MBZ7930968.1 malate dehydrogenase [Campylobacter sp. RM12910]MBZ7937969.1 malate dehydrogenase [Campylobacter sp. RM10538]MBZ7942716.1 malate dehydrogenase [Campylobacter sp. W0045]MBZ7944261.1 malate dehydrogenase [Campylobacter sp. RM13744]MBZ7945244.1 malate dehydrogenase [Campylobacter sp. RM10532]MBZ7946381.1 malate dehydrogenase [Campylobacter sp. RM10536]MBZ7948174.1 malate d
MNLREEALRYHLGGKVSITPLKPMDTSHDLSLAYSPGVAEPCLEIAKDKELAYLYTNKANLVAIVSDGSAVLGLGNIGAQASKPVMEGKACLFKKFANVNAYDIEINAHSVDEIVTFCKALAPTVGGINLEDIAAPKCFEIEAALQDLGIPVMHDDQHGTAIISTAGLMNAMEISGKKFKDIKVVVSGAGAAGIASAKMYRNLGVEHIVLVDSKGVVSKDRNDLTPQKLEFALDSKEKTLKDALKGADVFLGLSAPKILDDEMILSMAKDPVIFALANPIPEVMPEDVSRLRKDAIVGTGRSDYPNQINNVLGFPFIFRGALDVRATKITENMKIAAARALADLAKLPVSDAVKKAYEIDFLEFGRDYVIPKPFDERVRAAVSTAVAAAAVKDGVALIKEFDEKAYFESLK